MPLYLVERNFAEDLHADPELVGRILDVNNQTSIHWLFSFLSADKRKTYCLYEAPNQEAIREAARRLKIPADSVIEVTEENPLAYLDADEIESRSGFAPTAISPLTEGSTPTR